MNCVCGMLMASTDVDAGLAVLSELRVASVVDPLKFDAVHRLASESAAATKNLINSRSAAIRSYARRVDQAFEHFGGSFSGSCPVSPVSYEPSEGVLRVWVVPPGHPTAKSFEFHGVSISFSPESGGRVALTSWSPSGLRELDNPSIFSEERRTFVKLTSRVNSLSLFVSKVMWFFWMDDRWSGDGGALDQAVLSLTSGFSPGAKASDIGMFFVFAVHLYLRGHDDFRTPAGSDSSIVLEDDWHSVGDAMFDSSRLFLEGGMLCRYRHGFYTRYGFVAPSANRRDVFTEPSGSRLKTSKGRAVVLDPNFCISDIIPFFASHGASPRLISNFVDLTDDNF
mgnify:FL=1